MSRQLLYRGPRTMSIKSQSNKNFWSTLKKDFTLGLWTQIKLTRSIMHARDRKPDK